MQRWSSSIPPAGCIIFDPAVTRDLKQLRDLSRERSRLQVTMNTLADFRKVDGTVKDDDEARQEFVDLLEVMGVDDPRTAEWRRKLTAQLF